MIKVHVTFNGRLKNAIGIFYDITDEIILSDEEKENFTDSLYTKLYEKYEHIMQLKYTVKNQEL